MKTDISTLQSAFRKSNYLCSKTLLAAVFASVTCDRPLLVEGAPGVGKTSLAKALADGLGIPFIRCQMYDGLTADQILYDYDYQKQLLTLEAIRPKLETEYENLSLKETISQAVRSLDFYGRDFLIHRPVLRSITTPGHKVLLFDEIDKAPDEIEYMLYEFLENYSITIPQYGEMVCAEEDRPIVFLTSNRYRELSDAMKRRCNYVYLPKKEANEIIKIIAMKAEVDMDTATGIERCLSIINKRKVRNAPSIAEAVEFARFIRDNSPCSPDVIAGCVNILAKNQNDLHIVTEVISKEGALLWKSP